MKPKHQRLMYIVVALIAVGIAATLMARAFNEHLVFFYSPADIASLTPEKKARKIRLGGLVEEGSITTQDDITRFIVTDLSATLPVSYQGALPALFREGQGVVAEGYLQEDGTLKATTILAKHDENYMPPEVAEALKKSGRWKHAEEEAAPAPSPEPLP